ncbi:MAG: RluA family pseudouridine synthase [Deltaproteobacteria bacterium HGW-Deltaproteobacteria-10]|nr:MAG: RluA family pseudouridine synthase [Deltaproteobacteria bacterium HGW-Deltaproteobacteria-10]
MSPETNFTVTEKQSGQRLDVFLPQADPSLSRSQVKRAIEEGDVRVNGVMPKPSLRLKEGDIIRLSLRQAHESVAMPQEIPLNIVYEDAAIIVVNKEAGMVVHPAPGNYDRTLVNALLFHCHDLSGIGGVLRPGIVHRLDKGTSGLIVAAKSDTAHRNLTAQFKNHAVEKTYIALVWGDMKGDQGEIILPVGRHPGDRKKMSTRSKRGRDAITLWKVRQRYGLATLLDVEIKTGRTHQIRVHLSDRGYPVVGDAVYGNASKIRIIPDSALKAQFKALDRQALHAARLSFVHPATNRRIVFTAEMPEDMTGLCNHLSRLAKTA